MHKKIGAAVRVASTAAALALLASGVVTGAGAGAGPAWAGGSPVRVAQPSPHDATPTKLATVACPQAAQSVYAAGVRVVGGGGAVVITAMVPDPVLNSVTVTATARTGYPEDWSLVAYAVCDVSAIPPARVAGTAAGASTVTATCPGTSRLTGLGFRIDDPDGNTYLAGAAPDADLRQVHVGTRGDGSPASVTAYGICKPPTGPAASRPAATVPVQPTGTTTVFVAEPGGQGTIYGVGAAVSGPGTTLLSAIVPDLAGNRAVAAAAPAAGSTARTGPAAADEEDEDEEEDEVTVYGTFIGTFH